MEKYSTAFLYWASTAIIFAAIGLILLIAREWIGVAFVLLAVWSVRRAQRFIGK